MMAKRAYANLPFFDFLRDESIPPRQRLAFVPCMAPFILDFGDLNRFVMRDETSSDPLQQLVNVHTYEDDHHWPWYLEDLERLGYDDPRPTPDVLRDLYSDRTKVNRMLATKLAHLLYPATPAERLVIIEAIEETGHVLFELTAKLARQIEAAEGIELRYFGDFHLALESGHAQTGDDHRTLVAIPVDDDTRDRCNALATRVYDLFEEWVAELHDYAVEEAGLVERCA